MKNHYMIQKKKNLSKILINFIKIQKLQFKNSWVVSDPTQT